MRSWFLALSAQGFQPTPGASAASRVYAGSSSSEEDAVGWFLQKPMAFLHLRSATYGGKCHLEPSCSIPLYSNTGDTPGEAPPKSHCSIQPDSLQVNLPEIWHISQALQPGSWFEFNSGIPWVLKPALNLESPLRIIEATNMNTGIPGIMHSSPCNLQMGKLRLMRSKI